MRLVLIRHGESASNRRDMARLNSIMTGEKTEAEALAWARADAATHEPNGDTFLTENGEEQVELLGLYWAPLLTRAAGQGKLRVFCSPMRRNLQTAAPLLRELNALGTPVTAVVRRDNYEVMGMCHPADRAVVTQMEEFAGMADKRDELIQLVKSVKWTPAGQSPNEMLSEFPHIVLEPGAFGDPDEGWYAQGIEGAKQIRHRFTTMADWVESLRDNSDPDDVVLLITHGDMQGRLLNVLLARHLGLPDFKEGKDQSPNVYLGLHAGSNTSVSMLTLNPPGVVHRQQEQPEFAIEFSHRLDHLGPDSEPDTLMRGYKYLGLLASTESEREEGVGYWGLRIAPKM